MKRKILSGLWALMFIVGLSTVVFALSEYLSSFNSTYGTSATALNSCGLCHPTGGGNDSGNLNNFANDYAASGYDYGAIQNLDSDSDGYTNIEEINARTFPGDPASHPVTADMLLPTVTSFTIPSTATSLTISITTFIATDNVGVTGYVLTETSTKPAAVAAGWTTTAPVSYTFATAGAKTLYAWAKDAAGNVSTGIARAITITISTQSYTKNDFNADGKPDILWRNTSTGQNGVWYMNGVTNTGWGQLPTVSVSSNWTIVGTGDFNSDGKPDILWRNTSTGQNGVWYMNGVTNTGWGQLPTVSVSSNWTIVGTGDFNADGKPDILWRNTTTGQNGVWYMNGVTNTGWGQLPTVSVSSNWTIVGTDDFNADGKPDILWRNTSTGQNGVWYMNGVTNTGWGQLPTVSVSSNWTIVGTDDFNSDGKPDILWRNTSTGQNGVWYMNGVTNTGWGQLPTVTVSSNWTIPG